MKIKLKNIFSLGLLLITFFSFGNRVQADTFTYKPLTTLPGFFDQGKPVQTPEDLVSGAYTLAIGIASILAVLMIVWGGIKYIVSETPFEKGDGKKDIQNAFYGIIILLGAYIILRTINIDLVKRSVVFTTPTNNLGGLVAEQKAAEKAYEKALLEAKTARELENATKKQLEDLIKNIEGQKNAIALLKTNPLFEKCLLGLKNAPGAGEIAYAIDSNTSTIEELLIDANNDAVLNQVNLDRECIDLFNKIKGQANTLATTEEQKSKTESVLAQVRIKAEVSVLKSNLKNIIAYKGGTVDTSLFEGFFGENKGSAFNSNEIFERAIYFSKNSENKIEKELTKINNDNESLKSNLAFTKTIQNDFQEMQTILNRINQTRGVDSLDTDTVNGIGRLTNIINRNNSNTETLNQDARQLKTEILNAALDASQTGTDLSLRTLFCDYGSGRIYKGNQIQGISLICK